MKTKTTSYLGITGLLLTLLLGNFLPPLVLQNSSASSFFNCPTQSTLYVDSSATAGGDGLSWATAFNDLQDALNLACTCVEVTEVWVVQGTYFPSVPQDFDDNGLLEPREVVFSICNGLKVFGGFNGTELTRQARDIKTNATILSGDIDKDGILNTANSYHVVNGSETTINGRLDGFIIQDGFANGVTFNRVGGGMINKNSTIDISNCTFTNNEGDLGGSLYINGSSLLVTNCSFIGNTGGLRLINSSPYLVNCLISGNEVNHEGGGVYSSDFAFPTFINCTISGNTALNGGGGIANEVSSTATLINTIVWNNESLNFPATTFSSVFNNFSNTVASFSLIEYSGGSANWQANIGTDNGNNIDEDPVFIQNVNLFASFPNITGNLRLQSFSPAIDQASTVAVLGDSLDVDGDGDIFEPTPDLDLQNRVEGAQINIGAYESIGVDLSIVNCPTDIQVDATADSCARVVNWIEPNLIGADAPNFNLIQTEGLPSGSAFSVGIHTIKYSVEPLLNCSFTITVNDNGAPNAICQDIFLAITETVEIQPTDLDGGSTDLCSLNLFYNASQTSFNLNNVGQNIVQLTVLDEAGNIASCASTVTIESPCSVSSILYVNDNMSLNGDGQSWNTAFSDLQNALTLACSCSNITEIWVAEGIYFPSTLVDFDENTVLDPREAVFSMCNGVAVYGGFDGTESNLSERNFQNNPTILSGDIDSDGILNEGNSFHVVTTFGTDSTAKLDGFIIKHGYAFGSTFNRVGAGIINRFSEAVIANCIVKETIGDIGGSMYSNFSSPTIINCIFQGNLGTNGGGLRNVDASPTYITCIVSGNVVSEDGGGVINFDSSPNFINSVILGNIAENNGGGMINFSSTSTITNSIIWNNESNSLTTSTASSIVNADGSNSNISSSLIANSGGTTNWQPAIGLDLGNNIDTDPLFLTPVDLNAPTPNLTGDLRLQANSPAIDIGDNTVMPQDIFDIDQDGDTGEPTPDLDLQNRIQNGTIDLGAFEAMQVPVTINLLIELQGRTDYSGEYNIEIYTSTDLTQAAYSFTESIDPSGTIALELPMPGTYSIRVDRAKYLSRVMDNVTLMSGPNTVAFDLVNSKELRVGDANEDNFITLPDFSILSSSFNLAVNDPGYDGRADFDGNDQISALDFSLLATNLNTQGELPANIDGVEQRSGAIDPINPVVLKFQIPEYPIALGDVFEIQLVASTKQQLIDAVSSAFLYDSKRLELVGMRLGESLPLSLLKEVNKDAGIQIVAGALTDFPKGEVVVGYFKFRAIAAGEATITHSNDGEIDPEVTFGGHTLLGQMQNAIIQIGEPLMELTLYPVPTQNQLTVELAYPNDFETILRIINTSGQISWSQKYSGEIHETLNLKELPTGVYWMEAISGYKSVRKRFILIE